MSRDMCPHGFDLRVVGCIDCASGLTMQSEVQRLRALIKDVECGHAKLDEVAWDGEPRCPWCGCEHNRNEPHMDDCPAFTPEGDVK